MRCFGASSLQNQSHQKADDISKFLTYLVLLWTFFVAGAAHASYPVYADGDLADLRDGLGPEFIGVNTAPNMGERDGWTVGCVYSFAGEENIEYDGAKIVMSADYETVAETLKGDVDGESTSLVFADDLGSPVVDNVMVVDDGKTSIFAVTTDGDLELVPVTALPFVRGDANQDGRVNIADAVWEFSELFRDGPGKDCAHANDANGDGLYNGTDPVFILNYRFLEGPEPSAPFPDCGTVDDQMPADCADNDEC